MSTHSIDALRRIESICTRFEQARASSFEPIEPFLSETDAGSRTQLLQELIAIDVAIRTRSGETTLASDYAELAAGCDPPLYLSAIESIIRRNGDQQSGRPYSSRYEFLGVIGSGGNGSVWRVFDHQSQRKLAIKLLRDRFHQDKSAQQRLVREALLTGRLQHPGIPPIYDHGRLANGSHFFAMKLVGGETFAAILKRESADANADSQSKLLDIFEQLAQTVAYAHSQGVLHRDLKPHNVMVGDFGEVQVMDWGMAKHMGPAVNSEEASSLECNAEPSVDLGLDDTLPVTEDDSWNDVEQSLTAAGDVMGTPAYMSPEQARGEAKTMDFRSDVFSLGAILFEVLTGQRIHKVATIAEAIQRTATGDMTEAMQQLDDDRIHPELRQICKQCLHADRDHRPNDGSFVASAITNYIQGAQQRVRLAEINQHEATVRFDEERKRRRLQTFTAVSIAIVSLLGAGGAFWQWRNATDANSKTKAALTLADTRFDQAQSVVDDFLTEVADVRGDLARAPGAQEVRKKLLTKARDYYERFPEESDSPAIRLRLARSHSRLGMIEYILDPGGDGWLEEHQKSIDACDQLLRDDPENLDLLSVRATTYQNIGRSYGRIDDMKAGFAAYQKASLDYEMLVKLRGNEEDQFRLAQVYQNLGASQYGLRIGDRGEKYLLKALEIATPIQQANDDDAEMVEQVGRMHSMMGNLRGWGQRKWAECHKHYKAAIECSKKAASISPGMLEYQESIAQSQMNFAMSLTHQKAFGEAEEAFRESIAMWKKLASENPAASHYLRGVARTSATFGTFLLRRKRYEDSAEAYRAAANTYESLVLHEPKIRDNRYYAIHRHTNWIGVLFERDRKAGKADALEIAKAQVPIMTDLLETYVRESPQYSGLRFELAYWSILSDRSVDNELLLQWTNPEDADPDELTSDWRVSRGLALVQTGQPAKAVEVLAKHNKKKRSVTWYAVNCLAHIPTDMVTAAKQLGEAEKAIKKAGADDFAAHILFAMAKESFDNAEK